VDKIIHEEMGHLRTIFQMKQALVKKQEIDRGA
jgi:hypothetical protein